MTPEQRKVELNRRLDAISIHAEKIYDLMVPGMTVEVEISGSPIVVPGGVKRMHRLYIHRPLAYIKVRLG